MHVSKLKLRASPFPWTYSLFYPYSTGIDFIRQNLTSVYVRFCCLKSIPALEEPNLGIQMNRGELTKTFMVISNWKNP